MFSVLITGASRGLGLEFARQYSSDGWKVIATCRDPEGASELKKIPGDIDIMRMDIVDPTSVAAVAARTANQSIDVLLNNAGIPGPEGARSSFGNVDPEIWRHVMCVNALGPLKVTEAFIQHVKASEMKTIAFVSSRAGSISERGKLPHHRPGGSYVFRSTKAALNAVARSLTFDLNPRGIKVFVLHPGWVNTEAGGPNAPITAQTSVSGMRQIIERTSLEESSQFWSYDGQIIPW